jgi:hypothetical protein
MTDQALPFEPYRPWLDGERQQWNLADVHVVDGYLWARRRGRLATIIHQGVRYAVYGKACDLPRCFCDHRLKVVR